jgi:cell division protein FtsQ
MLPAIWNDDKLMSIIAGLFFALSTVLLGYAGVQWLVNRPVFALRQMSFSGEVEHLNLVSIKTDVVPRIQGGFFSMDLHDVRQLIEKQPWVRKASVRRVWPNGLSIEIEEHKVLARWGDSRLINTFGEVFSANLAEVADDGDMAILSGPKGSESLVAKTYVNTEMQLKPLGMRTMRLKLSDRYAWTLETDENLTIELGRDQEDFPLEKKFERLQKMYPRIQAEVMPKILSVDLRNPRGVAIRGERKVVAKTSATTRATLH